MIADSLLEQVLRLDVTLQACHARLAARSDAEALHDMRVSLRRLRSLLRPLRGMPGIDELERVAALLGQRSTPLRDSEVLLHEQLEPLGDCALIMPRRAELEAGYDVLLVSPEWQQLRSTLRLWPELWRQAQRNGALAGLGKRIRKGLAKQSRRLVEALGDPAHDRHRLRLLIKRVRYGAEAYPDLADLPDSAGKALKKAQAALGDWHDRLQWLEKAERERDLQPLCTRWRQELALAELAADQALLPLVRYFPGQ